MYIGGVLLSSLHSVFFPFPYPLPLILPEQTPFAFMPYYYYYYYQYFQALCRENLTYIRSGILFLRHVGQGHFGPRTSYVSPCGKSRTEQMPRWKQRWEVCWFQRCSSPQCSRAWTPARWSCLNQTSSLISYVTSDKLLISGFLLSSPHL